MQQLRYAYIIGLFAQKAGMGTEEAAKQFYDSDIYRGLADNYVNCTHRSDEELADALMREMSGG